VNHLLIVTR